MNTIGIDMGGTNIRVAKVDEQGNIIALEKFLTQTTPTGEDMANKIAELINELKDENTHAVGIGVPGQIDDAEGMILACVNLNMKNFPLGKIIAEKTGLEVHLNNDANVAAIGEALAGAGKGADIVYYVTWSTGIGGGLVINGKVINGANYYTGEIANLIMWPDDEFRHSFLNKGSLEGLCAGTAIARKSEELGFEKIEDMFAAYTAGNPQVVEFVEFITDTVARGLANITHVIEPNVFVFGGGVTLKSGEYLIPLVRAKYDEYLMPVLKGKIQIKINELGDNNGIIGAALMTK
ncbi:MAG: ROK family protein [Mycoplasmatales bacterium]